jgi:hypothetical protein
MAVSRDKQIGIGLVVLAALGGLVYRQQKVDSAKGSASEASASLPTISTSDDVTKVSLKNGDKPEVVLEKKGDKWVVTKPLEAAANQQNVKSLLENFKDLKVKEVIASNGTDDLKKSYELDADKAMHVVAWKDADKKLDLFFGKSGGRGEIMMVEGKPAIYAASGYSSYLYSREVKGWRDTDIFKFEDTNAVQFTIENKNGAFSFTKGEKWAGTFKGHAIERFDEEKVKDALRTFRSLSADDFGDGKTPADTGLDTPEATVTVTLKDNAGKYVLKVGKVSTGTSRYAQKDGEATVYTIASYAADFALAEESKFQAAKDAGVPVAAH